MFTAVDDLDTVYVPIGLGSGVCGMIGTRDALGLKTKNCRRSGRGRERLSLVIHCGPRGGDQLRIDIRRREAISDQSAKTSLPKSAEPKQRKELEARTQMRQAALQSGERT
jgi:hypothetical protein